MISVRKLTMTLKLLGIKVDDDMLKRIKKICSRKSASSSKNDAYIQIISAGLNVLEKTNIYSSEKIYALSARNFMENKYYIKKIYRLLFDVNKSKFNSPDEVWWSGFFGQVS